MIGDILKLGAAAVGIVVLVVASVSAISLITAPMRATTGVVNQTLAPSNIIATYEGFHNRWKEYEMRLAQIVEYKGNLARATSDDRKSFWEVNLSGVRASCRDLAAKYNADVAKTNRDIFRGREAPDSLDMSRCSQ